MTKRSAPRSASTSVSPLRENRSRRAWDSYWLTLQPKVTNANVFIGAGSIEKADRICYSGRVDRGHFRDSLISADKGDRREGNEYGQSPVCRRRRRGARHRGRDHLGLSPVS